jgi:hypothetical protein
MVTDNSIDADVVCSLQILLEIDMKKKTPKQATDESLPSVEETAEKLGSMTLTGKVPFCGCRPS